MKELTQLEIADNKINELQAEVNALRERLKMANAIGNEHARQLANIRNSIGFKGDKQDQAASFFTRCAIIAQEHPSYPEDNIVEQLEWKDGFYAGLALASSYAWAEHKGNKS